MRERERGGETVVVIINAIYAIYKNININILYYIKNYFTCECVYNFFSPHAFFGLSLSLLQYIFYCIIMCTYYNFNNMIHTNRIYIILLQILNTSYYALVRTSIINII